MNSAPICRALNVIILSGSALPDDFVLEKLGSKYCVHNELEVVAGGGVAVEVDGAGFFEDAAKLDEAWGHHGEVGEHVGAAEEGAEGSHGFGYAATAFDDFLIGALGFEVPLPTVFEGGDLAGGAAAVLLGEEDVVVLTGVEGRVEVDEVDGLVGDVVAEDFEVVAVVELVFWVGHGLG